MMSSSHPDQEMPSESDPGGAESTKKRVITISHNHEDGTLVSGSRKGDGVWEHARRHGFTYRQIPGIFIRGSRDRDANHFKIDGLAKSLREAGFTVVVDIDDTWRPAAEREAARGARVDERVDALSERADRAAARSAANDQTAREIAARRPLGQPILVGHHSEARARKDQDRIETATWRSIEEADYASHLNSRAEGAAANEAAKHRGPAIMRRIDRLEAEQRGIQRYFDQCKEGSPGYDRAKRELERLTEEITHLRGKLARLAADGTFVAWTPADFQKGDRVRVEGHWYPVKRVNRKTVSLTEDCWYSTVPYDNITGRRRDGQQWDHPHGTPWSAQLAIQVATWQQLWRRASLPTSEHSAQDFHVCAAPRLVHGLDIDAADAELAAFHLDQLDLDTRRNLAASYLRVYRRLEGDERVPQIRASLPDLGFTPEWRIPDADPVRRPASDLRPGDLIKGVLDTGYGNAERLSRRFAGPVERVAGPFTPNGWTSRMTVTLADGNRQDFRPYQMFAIFPADETSAVNVERGDTDG